MTIGCKMGSKIYLSEHYTTKKLIYAVLFIIAGVTFHWLAFHNIDNFVNAYNCQERLNSVGNYTFEIKETNALGWEFELRTIYYIGVIIYHISLFCVAVGFLLLGEVLKEIGIIHL